MSNKLNIKKVGGIEPESLLENNDGNNSIIRLCVKQNEVIYTINSLIDYLEKEGEGKVQISPDGKYAKIGNKFYKNDDFEEIVQPRKLKVRSEN